MFLQMAQRYPLADQCVMFDDRTSQLRWFMLPSEAQDLLLGNSQNVKQDVPFDPLHYGGSRGSIAEVSPLSRLTSPRHNSLPCTDQIRRKKVPLTLIHPPLFNANSASDGTLDKHCNNQTPLCFAVGQVVNPAAIMKKSPPSFLHNITNDFFPHRTRCHSLGSSTTITPPILSPQTMASLGIGIPVAGDMKLRQCSCSSQTDLNSLEFDSLGNYSPLPSLKSLQLNMSCASDYNGVGNSSPTLSSVSTQSPEDLQAYVKEVTKELATEIKYEIREVISKVEDVLSESTDSLGDTHQHERHNSSSNDLTRLDSVSANDVAEYLMEVSKEMASEMKSEIREMVNAVDVLISPDMHEEKSSLAASPVDTPSSYHGIGCLNTKLGELTQSSECSSDETVIHILSSDANKCESGSGANETDEEDSKQCAVVNSNSSQDSGINVNFQESDCSSAQLTDCASGTCFRPKESVTCPEVQENVVSARWHCPPKSIWKPSVEVGSYQCNLLLNCISFARFAS